MSATIPASRSAAPSLPASKPGDAESEVIQAVFEARSAASTAVGCIERGRIMGARRQLVRALAAINNAIEIARANPASQGGAV